MPVSRAVLDKSEEDVENQSPKLPVLLNEASQLIAVFSLGVRNWHLYSWCVVIVAILQVVGLYLEMWKLQGSVSKNLKNETCIHNLRLVCSVQLSQTYPGCHLFNFITLCHACGDCACTDAYAIHACRVLWRSNEALAHL